MTGQLTKCLSRGVVYAAMLVACCSAYAAEGSVNAQNSLDARSRAIIAISADTASGDLSGLEKNLVRGLESGLTVNEIKEVLVQLYAYTGFPRSLNGIHCFMKVMDERAKAGIKDPVGKEPTPVPADLNKDEYGARVRAKLGGRTEIPPAAGYQLFTPAIDTFLKEHLFCDIFIRDNLDARSRELATICALGGMTGTEGQLVFHLNAAMNTGTTEAQMQDYLAELKATAGEARAAAAAGVLEKVLAGRAETKKK